MDADIGEWKVPRRRLAGVDVEAIAGMLRSLIAIIGMFKKMDSKPIIFRADSPKTALGGNRQ